MGNKWYFLQVVKQVAWIRYLEPLWLRHTLCKTNPIKQTAFCTYSCKIIISYFKNSLLLWRTPEVLKNFFHFLPAHILFAGIMLHIAKLELPRCLPDPCDVWRGCPTTLPRSPGIRAASRKALAPHKFSSSGLLAGVACSMWLVLPNRPFMGQTEGQMSSGVKILLFENI